jgi:glycosyltransferase involved in cell wall biosynthesis
MLARRRPEVLHIFGFPMAYYGVLLGRLAGVRRIIFTVQDWDVWKRSRAYRWLDGVCSRLASLVIADGVGAKQLAVRAQGMPPKKFQVIYDGVNVGELAPSRSREEELRELGFDPCRPVAAVIARLDIRKKGQDIFLRAIPSVAREAPELQFLLVGGGPDEEALRRLARELPPEHLPRFAGFRTDLADLLHAVDIVVIPSLWESVPKILLEAMWCARAVVATRVGDIGEILDADCGILVRPGSPEEIAQALIRLARNPELRHALGSAAHRRVEAMGLTLEKSVCRYDETYHALLRRGR